MWRTELLYRNGRVMSHIWEFSFNDIILPGPPTPLHNHQFRHATPSLNFLNMASGSRKRTLDAFFNPAAKKRSPSQPSQQAEDGAPWPTDEVRCAIKEMFNFNNTSSRNPQHILHTSHIHSQSRTILSPFTMRSYGYQTAQPYQCRSTSTTYQTSTCCTMILIFLDLYLRTSSDS